MQTQSKEAHIRRSAALARRLGLGSEEARDFDAAAEFAVFERKSIAKALRDAGFGLQVIGSTVTTLPVSPQVTANADPVLVARLLAQQVLIDASFRCPAASRTLSRVWEHSRDVAVAARELAVKAGIDPETAWAAGLLHDIGRIAFSTLAANRQAEEADWLAAGFPLAYAETLAYGQDHAQFGAGLLRQWGLPVEIVDAVEFHHRPECMESRLCALVAMAENLSEDLWPDMRRMIAREKADLREEALMMAS